VSFEGIKDKVGRYYSGRLHEHGASARGVDWNSEESQVLRFVQLARVLPPSGPFSVVDYGCGYGALVDFLERESADFGYQGVGSVGSVVWFDANGNGVQDAGEPTGAATKTWVLPVTTPLCEIFIADGGLITALNGDKATFGGNARSSATGQTSGQQTYQDQGPAQPLTVKALSVLAIVCEGTTQASIYGQATINGSGSFFYRINVKDVGEPGVGRDTYWILLQNGYNSGQQTLEGGNVQIRRTQ